ncbi:hypothetical protein [Streptomyces sp. CNS654]|uniref:hypothetical protein n=1 Tax=Streptomyces sp. CNS654 TaxID=1506995 RepID=UPI000AE25243|nr:hypothetical protein [Streptomyces sp. CNS654]
MKDWTWEYEPDAENVVGGLDGAQRLEVEAIAQRIADAVGAAASVSPSTSPSRQPVSGRSLRGP